ncbi:NfeD family protein [Paenibacillus sonchi]|uniref:NfeD family protein n=1 Tax=Paenibacillus sonchi TaxID=373687 RepID=A0A974PDZ4_9BACL|nr:NfeD family protein [Paenibacillus sonchi]MCE3202885.1 NfeD family protein [Paenibacillus sonchi]QQZ61653.1 NfeD family protein [Paenibacillus sonchi]
MVVWVFWLIAAGVLFVVEMMTLTFYLLWLSIGALAACLVSLLLPDAILLQVLAGSLVALVLTIFSKPLVARFRSSRGFQDTGTDIVGRQGLVVEPIEPGRYGQVKVGGDTWSATSIESLGKDEVVKVVGRSSTIIEVVRWGDMY